MQGNLKNILHIFTLGMFIAVFMYEIKTEIMIDLVIKIFNMELHEVTAVVVLLCALWIIAAIIRIKRRMTKMELSDLEEKKIMLETAKVLKQATLETAEHLKQATLETAEHLKETTVETARILASGTTMQSCATLLSSINDKLNRVIDELDIVVKDKP